MTVGSLVSPQELYSSTNDERSFERNRTASLPVAVAEIVEDSFNLRDVNWNALFRYVRKHPAVVPVLAEASTAIAQAFGPVRPFLDLVLDAEDGMEQLFIVIPTTGSVQAALQHLRELDVSWFNAAARRAQFALNVAVE